MNRLFAIYMHSQYESEYLQYYNQTIVYRDGNWSNGYGMKESQSANIHMNRKSL